MNTNMSCRSTRSALSYTIYKVIAPYSIETVSSGIICLCSQTVIWNCTFQEIGNVMGFDGDSDEEKQRPLDLSIDRDENQVQRRFT